MAASNAEQFRACYEAYYRPLHRYVGRLSGDTAAVEDVTQEAFLRLWRILAAGAAIQNPRAWLFLVASREVVSRFRARRRANVVALADAAVMAVTAKVDIEGDLERRELVQRALEALPDPMRQAVLLYHAGLTGPEIAEVVGVKPSYVGTLVVRGHERFRRECAALGISNFLRRTGARLAPARLEC